MLPARRKKSVRILTGKENKFSVPIMASVVGMVDAIFVQPKLPRIQITYRNQNVCHTPVKGSACFKSRGKSLLHQRTRTLSFAPNILL